MPVGVHTPSGADADGTPDRTGAVSRATDQKPSATSGTTPVSRNAGPKPALVEDLGATYHCGQVREVLAAVRPDVVIEATGAPEVLTALFEASTPYQVTCLTGLPWAGGRAAVSLASAIRDTVVGNCAVVGSVNANVRHYEAAAKALAAADPAWLGGIISRCVPLDEAQDAFRPRPDDVKVVIDLDV